MAKIGIDIRTTFGDKTGKGWYTYHLTKELVRADTNNSYFLYASSSSSDRHAAEIAKSKNATLRKVKGGPLWHLRVIKDLKKNGIDIFFAPTSFIIPAFIPKSVKSIVTVHDLVAFLFPKNHQTKATLVEKLFLRRALRRAARVICVSENTKRDLIKMFHAQADCLEEKISVIYPASSVIPAADRKNVIPDLIGDLIDSRFRGNDKGKSGVTQGKYILGVGTLEPRKNFKTLIKAFALFHEKNPGVRLVVAGGEGWKEKLQIPEGLPIEFIGYVAPDRLAQLYRGALMFVFPSLYEGFGIPPLEAMSEGCPVICSNTSSLPEVCGDAALLVNPEDEKAIAAAMIKLISHEFIRKEMIEKGYAQAEKFSWKESARKLANIIKEV